MLRLTRAIDAIEKKEVKTCPGTVLQCTGNVAFSLLMNRGGFSRSGWAVWSLLRGITFRTIWIERKDAVFYDQKWHLQKVKIIIWKSLLDCDRVAWERCLWIVMKSLIAKHQYLRSFDKVICKREMWSILGGFWMASKGFWLAKWFGWAPYALRWWMFFPQRCSACDSAKTFLTSSSVIYFFQTGS